MLSIYMNKVDFNEVISIYYKEKTKKNININLLNYYFNIVKDKDFSESDLNVWLNNNFIIKNRKKKVKIEKNIDNKKLYIKEEVKKKYYFYFKKEINHNTLIYYYNILKTKDYSITDLNYFLDIEFSKNKIISVEKKVKNRKLKLIKEITIKKNNNKISNKKNIKKTNTKIKIKDEQSNIFIVIPNFNKDKCVELLKNLLNQKITRWKLQIFNNDLNNIDNCFKDNRIEIISTKENNFFKILNLGINNFLKSDYEYLVYLNEDNFYHNNFLEELINNKNKFTYSYFSNNDLIKERTYNSFYDLLKWTGIGLFMYNKDSLKKIGFFNTNLLLLEEYDFILRTFLILKKNEINCCNKVLMKSCCKNDYQNNLIERKIKLQEKKLKLNKYYNYIFNNKIELNKTILVFTKIRKFNYNLKSRILKIPEEYNFIKN